MTGHSSDVLQFAITTRGGIIKLGSEKMEVTQEEAFSET